jgi:hypothetical protein
MAGIDERRVREILTILSLGLKILGEQDDAQEAQFEAARAWLLAIYIDR